MWWDKDEGRWWRWLWIRIPTAGRETNRAVHLEGIVRCALRGAPFTLKLRGDVNNQTGNYVMPRDINKHKKDQSAWRICDGVVDDKSKLWPYPVFLVVHDNIKNFYWCVWENIDIKFMLRPPLRKGNLWKSTREEEEEGNPRHGGDAPRDPYGSSETPRDCSASVGTFLCTQNKPRVSVIQRFDRRTLSHITSQLPSFMFGVLFYFAGAVSRNPHKLPVVVRKNLVKVFTLQLNVLTDLVCFIGETVLFILFLWNVCRLRHGVCVKDIRIAKKWEYYATYPPFISSTSVRRKCGSPDLHYVVLMPPSCPRAGLKQDRRDGIWLVSVDYY